MHPILLTGLVSAGKAVLGQVFAPKKPVAPEMDFAKFMQNSTTASSNESGIASFLQSNNVNSANDLSALKKHLIAQLLNHPELGDTFKQANLVSDQDGFHLNNGTNHKVSLSSNPELNRLALRIHQLSAIEDAQKMFPGAEVNTLAQRIAERPMLQANWNIA